jgi:hypothetical protein
MRNAETQMLHRGFFFILKWLLLGHYRYEILMVLDCALRAFLSGEQWFGCWWIKGSREFVCQELPSWGFNRVSYFSCSSSVRTTTSPKPQPQSNGWASSTEPSDPTAPPRGHDNWNVIEGFQISILAEPLLCSPRISDFGSRSSVRTTTSPKSQPQSIGRASSTQPSDPTAPPCGHGHWNVVEDSLISIHVAALILLYSCIQSKWSNLS